MTFSAARSSTKFLSRLPRSTSASARPATAGRTLATEATSTSLATSTILSRSPFLTPTPTAFESAYYDYQSRIARALTTPFPSAWYFKKGSILERKFELEERQREIATFGEDFVKKVEVSSDGLDLSAEEQIALMPRESQAEDDFRSLNRKGDRNLYLLLKKKNGAWEFPQSAAGNKEPLHRAARRELHAECGPDMDTWYVGRRPIGVSVDPTTSIKTFFFKAHIFAGQARVNSGSDFAWLTKEEVEKRVDGKYWASVKELLLDS